MQQQQQEIGGIFPHPFYEASTRIISKAHNIQQQKKARQISLINIVPKIEIFNKIPANRHSKF